MQGILGIQGIGIKKPKNMLCLLGIHKYICETFTDDLGVSYFYGTFICEHCKKRKNK
jgi:hypothetical protein